MPDLHDMWYGVHLGGEYVCTDNDPRWKEERKKLITGTAIASIMGLSKFQSREQLLDHIKAGSPEIDFEHDAKQRMWWGNHCEDSNRLAFEAITGLHTASYKVLRRSQESPWLGVTLDALVSLENRSPAITPPPLSGLARTGFLERFESMLELCDGLGILEMKQTSRVGEWSDRVPEYYWTQVQCGLYVTGLTWGVCCAKIGAADMRFHVIERDNKFIDDMLSETEKFAKEAGLL